MNTAQSVFISFSKIIKQQTIIFAFIFGILTVYHRPQMFGDQIFRHFFIPIFRYFSRFFRCFIIKQGYGFRQIQAPIRMLRSQIKSVKHQSQSLFIFFQCFKDNRQIIAQFRRFRRNSHRRPIFFQGLKSTLALTKHIGIIGMCLQIVIV